MAANIEHFQELAESLWLNLPSELLIIIFENLDSETLISCMYINEKWRDAAKFVAKTKNMYSSMIEANYIDCSLQYKLKSEDLSWEQIYLNSLQWYYTDKADINLHGEHMLPHIKSVNVYKDNLIVVICDYVKYYSIPDFELRRDINVKCIDFVENDSMVMKVCPYYNNKRLYMYGKIAPDDFNTYEENVMFVDDVVLYRLVDNKCYVMGDRDLLTVYVYSDENWKKMFLCKYTGSLGELCALNVFKEDVLLLLKGRLDHADTETGRMVKMFDITFPNVWKRGNIYTKMFHKFGVVFGVPSNKEFRCKRYIEKGHAVFILKCPKLSCVTEHGDVLFLGYADGNVDIYIPRLLSNPLTRRIDIKQLNPDLQDIAVVSIDVFEDKACHRLYVATHSNVLQICITYPDSESFMWSEIPKLAYIN